MKMIKKLFAGFFITIFFLQCNAQEKKILTAEMNNVKLSFHTDPEGRPIYSVTYKNKTIIAPSAMGFVLKDAPGFYKSFTVVSTEKKTFDETWQPVWGEVKNIRNHYEQLTVHLQQLNTPARLLNIIFRVFEDGAAFRYEFPKQDSLKYFVVSSEKTQFNLAGDHTAFWIPGDFDSNEYEYSTSPISKIDNKEIVEKSTAIAVRTAPDRYCVQTPLMMKSADGIYINIHEAAQSNFPAMQLHADNKTFQLTSCLVPAPGGDKAYVHAPFNSPWRTIIVSDKAAEILSSKMILNLNEPSKIKNTAWIKPMKFVGVWWEMQTGVGGWNYSNYADSTDRAGNLIRNATHSANTANVKRYIDFAAANGMDGVLVEGWNTGWEDWFGNWKENVFDFVTPYPDFNVSVLEAYAASKGVQMIMHNETSGSATNYERQMDTAFRFMNNNGYHAVKTGYVGKIIPRGEYHDGQWMMNHYERVAAKAASYNIMVDMHEPSRPTGLQRTWPNWMANEAGRGNEYNAFSTGNAPEHETILPFTRLMGGPMDYTPGIFKLKNYGADPAKQVHTTLAKQLALYVTIYSPLQMVSDLPQNYAAHPDAFQFIKDVPVDWDDTRVIEAEPGDYITIARKKKNSLSWFIGSITDEKGRTATIPLDFLDKNTRYVATIYKDGPNAGWKNNPESYSIEKLEISSKTVLTIKLAEGGGAAVSIEPVVL
ncbi:MAG: Alpha-glucosidase [Ferruginibacter sp.]|nr:Alpha-glucosidase [Ferruginibacter sp.]